ncbi:hypothetical protein [Actinosynnema sp. NPDC023587]|uniref:hypothetical protein n=1 Tax=Actinosynnema sp. NPDC023587 TaxID=3154695 RepID=UPI0033EA49CD
MRTARATGGGIGSGEAVAVEEVGARPVASDAADPRAVPEPAAELPSTVDVLVDNAGGAVGGGDLRAQWRANDEADVVAAVAFPTSPEAGHIIGRVLAVNGGAAPGR